MNRWLSAAATALLLLAIVVTRALAVAWQALPLDGTTITIDGERFSLGSLSGGHAAAAFAIGVVVTMAALVVAAVAIVFAIVVAALGVGLGVVATVASLALVASPFLIVGWLVWRAVRRDRAAAATVQAA